MPVFRLLAITAALVSLAACEKTPEHHPETKIAKSTTGQPAADAPAKREFKAMEYIAAGERYNDEAVIPPQCYTKTESVNNPCYVCHQSYEKKTGRTNLKGDGFLQGDYDFSEVGETNHWKNLFKDRTEEIAGISDEFIQDYIDQENYTDLIRWMESDAWTGAVPVIKDLEKGAVAFDEFGLAKDGSLWVAFNYKPVPSTFWPTNGSTDDVMIRLAKPFREVNGEYSRDLYYANLAMVELAISGKEKVSTPPLNEVAAGIDFNADGKLSDSVNEVVIQEQYLGDAKDQPVHHMLYPHHTEFLHTVRYVGFDENGKVTVSPRFKEFRYMVRAGEPDPQKLVSVYYREDKEKFLENLPSATDLGDRGMTNSFGWLVWGFIEDEHGALRKQHNEEQFFCMGCHKAIGSTIDHTFSFPRKVAGAEGWGYIDLAKIQDVPNLNETQGEYLTYLERVGGGDEFRQNEEMLSRWFDENGLVNKDKVQSVANIHELITPSKPRALALNKAYYLIVKEQSYLYGRDAVLKPATNVIEKIDTEIPPLDKSKRFEWDIRLDWSAKPEALMNVAGELKNIQ